MGGRGASSMARTSGAGLKAGGSSDGSPKSYAGGGILGEPSEKSIGRFGFYSFGNSDYTSIVSSVKDWEKGDQKRRYFNLQTEREGTGYSIMGGSLRYDLGGRTTSGVPSSVFYDVSGNAPADKFRSVKTQMGTVKYSTFGMNPKNYEKFDGAVRQMFVRSDKARHQDFLAEYKKRKSR